jgi:hypothetical protein
MSVIQKIKEIEDEVSPVHMSSRSSTNSSSSRLIDGALRVCLLCCLQMARTQKNKATSGHLGMLKVSEGAGSPA